MELRITEWCREGDNVLSPRHLAEAPINEELFSTGCGPLDEGTQRKYGLVDLSRYFDLSDPYGYRGVYLELETLTGGRWLWMRVEPGVNVDITG